MYLPLTYSFYAYPQCHYWDIPEIPTDNSQYLAKIPKKVEVTRKEFH